MKTVIIFDSMGENPIQFFSMEGDLRKLNNIYINGSTDEECDLLNDVLYWEDGNTKVPALTEFPIDAVKQGAFVIVCGFVP